MKKRKRITRKTLTKLERTNKLKHDKDGSKKLTLEKSNENKIS